MNTTWSNLTEADWLAALRPLIDSTFRAGMLAGMAVAAEAVDDAPAAVIRALAADTRTSQAETALLEKLLKLMRDLSS